MQVGITEAVPVELIYNSDTGLRDARPGFFDPVGLQDDHVAAIASLLGEKATDGRVFGDWRQKLEKSVSEPVDGIAKFIAGDPGIFVGMKRPEYPTRGRFPFHRNWQCGR